MTAKDRRIDNVETFLKSEKIDEVECLVPDMAGIARGKILPADKFLRGMRELGLRIPEQIFIQTVNGEYAVGDGVTSPASMDVYLQPDLDTIRTVPWYDEPTAQVICDAFYFDSGAVEIAPRHVLKRVLQAYDEQGWMPLVAPELEFYLVEVNTDPDYPLVLNSGRVRDHWHTMTRTAKSPRLSRHTLEPCLELHPADAMVCGVRDEGLVQVTSRWGEAVLRARVSRDQRRGSVFAPIHWNGRHSSLPTVDVLINPETDPVSGQPEFKHTPVRIEDWRPQWFGFILSRTALEVNAAGYWCRARIAEGLWRYEIAGRSAQDWEALVQSLRPAAADSEWVEFSDQAAGRYRAARLVGDCLELCVFIGPDTGLPSREWLGQLFDKSVLDAGDRGSLLSGVPINASALPGRTVCACFGVGLRTLEDAIRENRLTSVDAIGKLLKAGTNCGSCVPELRQLLVDNAG